MSTQNDGGSFHPVPLTSLASGTVTIHKSEANWTVRDEFAAKALAALIAVPKDDVKRGAAGVPILAQYAYEYADAMLAERAKVKA